MKEPSIRLLDSITKDNLWIYILSLLMKKEMYPYEIRREITKAFGFNPGLVTAYVVLYKLEKDGYVKSGEKMKISGPERKYYKITPKGKDELKKGKIIFKKLLNNKLI